MLAALLIAGLVSGVEVRAEPPLLRLDRADRAELSFRAPPGDLRVQCSAGSLGDLREVAAGEWRATWHAPRAHLPRVAVIVARSGDAVGFLALPLWGQGEAEVRTRPGAVVDVRIGLETFGPMRAGKDGRAFVPVVVPPGVDYAEQGARQIDLKVPRTRTVQLAPMPLVLEADRERSVEIAVAAVTRGGAPLEAARLQLEASRGEIAGLTPLAPGLYRATWHLAAGPAAAAVVSATVPGDPDRARAEVQLVAGAAARIELSAARQQAAAGGPALELRALAFDAAGNATADPLELAASSGALSSEAQSDGRYRLLFEAPRTLGPDRAATLTARSARTGASATLRIALASGTAERAEVLPERAAVIADGHSPVQVRVVLRDRFGNETSGAPELVADAGSVSAPVADGHGFLATFVPPLLHEGGAATVAVRAGAAQGQARVALRPSIRGLALSARTGFFSDLHGLAAPLLGVEGALRTQALGVQLALVLDLTWAGGRQGGAVGGNVLDARDDFLIGSIAGAIRLPLSDRSAIWAQAGAALVGAAASVRVSGAARGDATSRGAVPGI
ncbi:MAG TPA: hypothetical protein VFP52_12120, partial [Myxococcales bacterium]|nr:hypothetical protein [Myxococcales bacterium]